MTHNERLGSIVLIIMTLVFGALTLAAIVRLSCYGIAHFDQCANTKEVCKHINLVNE